MPKAIPIYIRRGVSEAEAPCSAASSSARRWSAPSTGPALRGKWARRGFARFLKSSKRSAHVKTTARTGTVRLAA